MLFSEEVTASLEQGKLDFLMSAIILKQPEKIKNVLKEKASLNMRNKKGQILLIVAAELATENTGFACLEALIEAGANVNEKNWLKETALMVAETNKVTAYLLQQGANLDDEDVCGFTPLMHAIQKNSIDIVMTLLQAGASTHLLNSHHETALNFANYCGNQKIIKCLRDWNNLYPQACSLALS